MIALATATATAASTARVTRLLNAFVRSDDFATWQAEHLESGGYAPAWTDARNRYERCYDAAAVGADGSTHREAIDDMRSAFADHLRTAARRRPFGAGYDRLESAAGDYFDTLESWHVDHGTIDDEIG